MKIITVVVIGLWGIGSFLIFRGTNGESIGVSTAIIILVGLYTQIKKDRKEKSEQ